MPLLSKNVGLLDESSSLPLYQQLQRALRVAIGQRLLEPEDALPAERNLATELDVSRITVRKAIDGLVGEGLLVRRQGSDTFGRARVAKIARSALHSGAGGPACGARERRGAACRALGFSQGWESR